MKVGIPSPDERLAAYPHQFSGGMRQRVAIAIALLNNPDLIIADEPTTALDVTIQGQILFEMQKLTRETGAAMIWITHDLSVVAGLADRVCVMYAGRIVEQGSVFDVLTHPRHPYTQGLLDSVPSRSARGARLRQIPGMPPSVLDLPEGCAFRERCNRATGICATTPGDAARGRRRTRRALSPSARARRRVVTNATAPARTTAGAPPLVELSRVAKRFVKSLDVSARIGNLLGAGMREEVVHAVDDVDLAIVEGEVVGLVGESGCGKSTLGRLAVGLLPLTGGERRWRGVSLAGQAPDAARRQQLKMQMIFQDPYASLNPRMRVVDIVGEAPVAHGLVAAKTQPDYVAQQMNRVGLDASLMRRFPHQFSGGQRARIGIARALAVAPEFLVCDESVAALDVSIQAQVLNLFMDLKSALNLTYLFISHDLRVVEHISDRVVIMYLGRVVESGPTPELYASPNHPYTQALLKEVGKVEPGQAHVRADQGRDPVAARAAPGLPLPSAVPARDAEMPHDVAGIARDRAGPLVGVSLERWRMRHSTSMGATRAHGDRGRALRAAPARRDGAAARARLAPFRASTIPTTSTTRRRARSCDSPRTRTSRGSIAARHGSARR